MVQIDLVERLQFLTGLEANGFPGRDGYFSASARVTANTGFSWTDVEDAKASQFNSFATAQRSLHALKDGLDSHFRLGFSNASPIDDFVDDVEFNQVRLPSANSMIGRELIECQAVRTVDLARVLC